MVDAPALSHFMVSMPSGVLSDSPPESNVTPLPTMASAGALLAAPEYRKITSRGGRLDPLATATSAPQRSASSRFWSQISIFRPFCLATSAARAAKVSG